jgi:hypothetical protein
MQSFPNQRSETAPRPYKAAIPDWKSPSHRKRIIAHNDNLDFDVIVRPGGVNVMTAGHGIAHAEQTPATEHASSEWRAVMDRAAGRIAPHQPVV